MMSEDGPQHWNQIATLGAFPWHDGVTTIRSIKICKKTEQTPDPGEAKNGHSIRTMCAPIKHMFKLNGFPCCIRGDIQIMHGTAHWWGNNATWNAWIWRWPKTGELEQIYTKIGITIYCQENRLVIANDKCSIVKSRSQITRWLNDWSPKKILCPAYIALCSRISFNYESLRKCSNNVINVIDWTCKFRFPPLAVMDSHDRASNEPLLAHGTPSPWNSNGIFVVCECVRRRHFENGEHPLTECHHKMLSELRRGPRIRKSKLPRKWYHRNATIVWGNKKYCVMRCKPQLLPFVTLSGISWAMNVGTSPST